MNDFQRIERAIAYVHENFRDQPSLEEIAKHIYLSPYHFQRLFVKWAGVSPKKFLQYTTIEYAKLLLNRQASLSKTTHETGLSGTGRLHDLFVSIEKMTPGEYKSGGKDLIIQCSSHDSPFGRVNIASTNVGICHLSFSDIPCIDELKTIYPHAKMILEVPVSHFEALKIINGLDPVHKIVLHIKGTDFQLKVWNALLNIPSGLLTSYGELAKDIGAQDASRAVGTAIGKNPIAYLIPCHRVILKNGISGAYKWGPGRKLCLNGLEALHSNVATLPVRERLG